MLHGEDVERTQRAILLANVRQRYPLITRRQNITWFQIDGYRIVRPHCDDSTRWQAQQRCCDHRSQGFVPSAPRRKRSRRIACSLHTSSMRLGLPGFTVPLFIPMQPVADCSIPITHPMGCQAFGVAGPVQRDRLSALLAIFVRRAAAEPCIFPFLHGPVDLRTTNSVSNV